MLPIRASGLTIRAMTEADAAQVQASRVHPDNERYNGWRPATVEEVAHHARTQDPTRIGTAVGTIQLVIEHDEGGSAHFAGDFGVQTREPLPTVELGIVLAPTAKGRGSATRASRLLLDALFAGGIHRVVARVDPRNAPSLRLFDRLGFRREGHEQQAYWDDAYQEWTDEIVFATLASQWR